VNRDSSKTFGARCQVSYTEGGTTYVFSHRDRANRCADQMEKTKRWFELRNTDNNRWCVFVGDDIAYAHGTLLRTNCDFQDYAEAA